MIKEVTQQETTEKCKMRNKKINYFVYLLVTTFLFLITISLVMGADIPPDPTNIGNSTGDFWVHFTWDEGSGNVTDSYNVSTNNGTGVVWDNGSLNLFSNTSTTAHGYVNITVYAYNNSDGGILSAGYLTDNVTVPNNAPVVTNVSSTYEINETETLYIDADFTDADSDTGTFADNSSEWDINTTTGVVSWVTDSNDEGTYNYYINVSDGYGSVNQYNFTVTVNPIPFTVALHSTYPTGALATNYTGVVSAHYVVQHNQPLNFSSLAFLYGINYTVTGDMHSYVKAPENSISFEGIYRGPYRNRTPYLSWEFNNTITNNNVWQWGGYDNDSVYVSNSPINITHAWINVTGRTQEILSSSFYIARQSMYESPKTGFEINKAQGIIIKIWDVEKIRGRDSNYLISLIFDTDLEATPSANTLIRYCNASFDPDNHDPRTSSYCQNVITADGTRWMNHTWIPHANCSYSKPLIVDPSNFDPTDTGFLYLSSGTTTGKSFILNATDYDPGVCNRTFAQTQTMWTFAEIAGVSTSINYTPSFFALFARDYMEMEFKFHIADNQGDWAYSGIDNKSIGLSHYPVDPVTFEHFNITCPIEGYILDDMMDATYDNGYMNIGLHCPGDPDGGNVSHNVTVHYLNGTLVGVINNTLITNGSEHVEINFSTTSYYSTTDIYTLKCVSTDDEGSIVTKWLDSEFTLAADGTQGWVKDDMLLFWGMNDIPTLYSTVNNDSYISYNVSNDIYTTHVPFFKSKCNDTFRFNETVHLESLNDTNISFFRFSGTTIFDNATIHAWNITSDAVAPDTDEYRGYLFSCCNVDGDMMNSNFSYLGSNIYREEGLNFVGNSYDYLIYNTTLSHNGGGVIMEECSNFNISHCTITDNINVGIGIYYSNNTIVANNTIDSNAESGVAMYKAHNSIIRYNDITNSGIHGVHYQSNSLNNTCIGNNITGSTLYDYYLTSSSTDNFIIDPASVTNIIRSTSTSSVNIENSDNAAFTEDSLNTSYAYPTNFSMFVTDVSQTFNITQRNMIIIPSTDKLSVWNVEWNITAKFNISSETANNPTWFNLTNSTWASKLVDIYRNGTLYANETADGNGLITYNYSDSYSEKWFEFQEQSAHIPPDPISLTNSTGIHWVRYDWSPGAGNVTDSYNVSYNGTWDNTSSNTFRNESVGAHGYLEIIVYAWNNSGGGTLSAGYLTDNVTVPNNVPTQSSSHTDLGTHLIDHTPTITWTKGTDVDGDTVTTYIYVGTTSTPTAEEGHTTSETLNLGSTITLNDGVTYYWRTRSYDGYEYSAYTAADEFRMNTPPTIPTSFTNLGNNLIDHTPTITWTKGTDNESDTVNTYVYVDIGANPTTEEGHNTGTTIDLGSTVTLNDGITYYYKLRSWDGYEWSSYTADDQFRMNTPPTVPTSPTDLGTRLTDHTPDVSWTASTDSESDGITYYVESQDITAVWDADWNGTGVSTSLDANTWDDGEAGKWRVRAYDGYEYGSYTTEDTFQMNTIPTTTSLLTAGATNPTEVFSSTLTFSWTYGDGDSDAQSHWEIYVGTASGLSDKWNSDQLSGADVSDVYAGSSLTRGTTYYVQVRTKDGYEWTTWATGTFILGTFNPPDPISLTNSTGIHWVRYDWSPGAGNVTDSYNVSYNGTWDNTSSNTFRNESVGAHGFLDIEVYAYNNTGDILSTGSLIDNVTVPNNPINITNTSDYDGMENVQVLIDFNHTDIDGDAPFFQTNASVGFLNSSTGVFNWMPSSSDAGTHYFEFNVSDGHGSVDSYVSTLSITAFGLTSPSPENNTEIYKGKTPTFSILASALANSTWMLDNVLVDTDDINKTIPEYTIPIDLDEGSHELLINSAMVSNLSVTEEYLWNFTIIPSKITSSGGSGSSGISSGTSKEPSFNVLCKEVGYIRNIKHNEITSYTVKNHECLKITSVSFVPDSNSRQQTIYIESLVGRSYFVSENVPNYEILNFNLFVGFLGYRIEHEIISFKVKKTVIRDNGLDENTVKLYRWSSDKEAWVRKYTELTDSDEHYYYYESESDSIYGNFAITGEEFIPVEEPLSLLEEVENKIVSLVEPDNGVVKDGYGILGVVIVFILSSLSIGAVSIYYNSGKWTISMIISVLLIGIIYIFLGSNMISIFNSNIINLLINAALISSVSYSAPAMFEGIKGKLEAN